MMNSDTCTRSTPTSHLFLKPMGNWLRWSLVQMYLGPLETGVKNLAWWRYKTEFGWALVGRISHYANSSILFATTPEHRELIATLVTTLSEFMIRRVPQLRKSNVSYYPFTKVSNSLISIMKLAGPGITICQISLISTHLLSVDYICFVLLSINTLSAPMMT